ncbi:hypothetical protein HY493_00715 [Candidatus Woesearchaeota archaeon]|nr:hypothetical protein [Candidatus Woesearchaeota archaeon]
MANDDDAPMRRFKPVPALLLIGFLVATALYVFRPGGEEGMVVLGDLLYVAFAVVATISGFIVARANPPKTLPRIALTLFTLMVAADALAGIVFAYHEIGLGVRNPFPTIADGIWILFYVFGILGMLTVTRRLWRFISPWKILTATAATAGLLAVTYSSFLRPIAADSGATLAETVISAMYPVGDILLIGFAFLLFLSLRGNIFGRPGRTFLLAFVVYAIADLSYIHKTYLGTYITGDMVDLLWFAGQLLMAYAFYQQLKTGGK